MNKDELYRQGLKRLAKMDDKEQWWRLGKDEQWKTIIKQLKTTKADYKQWWGTMWQRRIIKDNE